MFTKISDMDTPSIYHTLVNGVVPRPIAWVSTIDQQGVSNLAPYSFFGVASVNPPVLTITTVPARDKLEKDTLKNLRETGDCVIHVVTEELAEVMNLSCANYEAGVSEIDALSLQTVNSELVTAPSLKQVPVRFECKLRDTVEISAQPAGGVLILLDVVGVYMADSVSAENKLNPAALNILGKLGGNDYSNTAVTLQMARPEN